MAPVASANTVSPSSGVCARPDGAGQAVVRGDRDAAAPGRAQRGVGGDHGDGGVERAELGVRSANAAIWSAGGAVRSELVDRYASHGSPVAGSTTSPAALTTTKAPTVTPDSEHHRRRSHPALENPDPRAGPRTDVADATSVPAFSAAA